jgi:predicted O-methyltransferase YrrM
MDEHFHFNNSRMGTAPQYFNDPISRVSCPKWDKEDPSTPLKTANFTPWRDDWIELLQYVDVIKMHGRESSRKLFETISIIQNFANDKEILFDTFNDYLVETNLVEKPIFAWRKKIKNCKFDCWDCNFCDKIYETKSDIKTHPLVLAVTKELVDSVNNKLDINTIGLTSNRVQQLLGSLSYHCKSYLEVGCALGATAAAVALNNNIKLHFVDNWSQDLQPETGLFEMPNNDKAIFIDNIRRTDAVIIDSDFLSAEKSLINDVDLLFYDGPHDKESVKQAVIYYKDCLAKSAILIFDDANWDGVVAGANEGIAESNLMPIYSKMMLNQVESADQWWNGLYIVVVKND